MLKILTLVFAASILQSAVTAQVVAPIVIKKTITPITPAPVPVYTLKAVRVSFQTGNDNKEFGAMLYLALYQKNKPVPIYTVPEGISIKNELPVNSIMDFGLEIYGNPDRLKLETLQQTGLSLSIVYSPAFFLDAWRIEGVTLTLEFKDQYNNPHPVFGKKAIFFSTAKGILNNTYSFMTCFTDGNFTALTAPITDKMIN